MTSPAERARERAREMRVCIYSRRATLLCLLSSMFARRKRRRRRRDDVRRGRAARSDDDDTQSRSGVDGGETRFSHNSTNASVLVCCCCFFFCFCFFFFFGNKPAGNVSCSRIQNRLLFHIWLILILNRNNKLRVIYNNHLKYVNVITNSKVEEKNMKIDNSDLR